MPREHAIKEHVVQKQNNASHLAWDNQYQDQNIRKKDSPFNN